MSWVLAERKKFECLAGTLRLLSIALLCLLLLLQKEPSMLKQQIAHALQWPKQAFFHSFLLGTCFLMKLEISFCSSFPAVSRDHESHLVTWNPVTRMTVRFLWIHISDWVPSAPADDLLLSGANFHIEARWSPVIVSFLRVCRI